LKAHTFSNTSFFLIKKKGSSLDINTRKLEHVLYEMSLSKLTGFNIMKADSFDTIAKNVEGGGDAGDGKDEF
jgi:hypothetical protein